MTSIPETGFDLNLMRVLVAIRETGSVTLAADLLGVTQPTVSYGLGKLREAYGDPLFVRGGGLMAPTAVGAAVAARFAELLAGVAATLSERRHFDPATERRRARLAMSDIGELYFTPPLLEHLARHAPQVELEVVQSPMDEIANALAAGRVDAAIGNMPALRASTRSARLFDERYLCLVAADHPRIGERLRRSEFAAERHVMVSSPSSGHDAVEEALAQRGIHRHIAVRVAHFTALPFMIARSDLLVTLPSRVARLYASQGGLRALALPVAIPGFEVRAHWHGRQESDPFHAWLIAQIGQALGSL